MQMQTQQSVLREMKRTFALALPIMLSQLSHMVTQMTDSVMVGRLGSVELAASAFSGTVFAIFLIFCFGFSSILSSWVAKAIGEKRPQAVGDILWHGLVLNFIISGLSVILLLCVLPHLAIFRQTPEVTMAAREFLFYISLSIMPVCLFAVYARFLEGVSLPMPGMVMAWLGVVLNLVLNWLLIFGKFGFPALGLAGSGLATLLTRILLFLMIFVYVHGLAKFKMYDVQIRFLRVKFDFLKKLFVTSLPSGLMSLNEVVAFASGGIMMGWIGTKELAAHQIALNLASCSFVVAMGLSFASTVRVGEAFGRQNQHEILRVAKSSFLSMLLMMTVSAVLFVLLRHQLPYLYIKDTEVIALAAQLLIVAAFFQLFDGTQCLGIALNKGIMEVQLPFWITVFSYWGLCLPFSYVLAFRYGLGPMGIWWGYLLCLISASVLLNARFFYLVKKRQKFGSVG